MTAEQKRGLRGLEGHEFHLALIDGSRIYDADLVSARGITPLVLQQRRGCLRMHGRGPRRLGDASRQTGRCLTTAGRSSERSYSSRLRDRRG